MTLVVYQELTIQCFPKDILIINHQYYILSIKSRFKYLIKHFENILWMMPILFSPSPKKKFLSDIQL